MQELTFTVSADSKVKGITYGTLALLVGTFVFVGAVIYAGEGASRGFHTTLFLMGVTYFIIAFFAWAYSPRRYLLTDEGVVIERPAKDVIIPYSSISMVEKKESLGNRMIRQMGNGGLFSFSGTFRSKEMGKVRMYVKNRNYVIIHADETYVLSPDERDEFLMMLNSRLRRPL